MDLGLQVVVLLLLAVQCWITRHRLAVLMTLAVAMHFVWRDNINGLLAATLFAESAWLADLGVKVGIYLSAGALAVLMYALGEPLALSLRMRRLVGGFALLSLACVVLAIAGIFTPVVRTTCRSVSASAQPCCSCWRATAACRPDGAGRRCSAWVCTPRYRPPPWARS